MSKPTVIITRTQPYADVLAERVRVLGYDAYAMPLLKAEATGIPCPARKFDGAIITSSQALRFLPPEFPRTMPVFTVGYGTANAARAAGFEDVREGGGDVQVLGRTVRATNPTGTWVHISAEEPAAETADALRGIGDKLHAWPIYRTVGMPLDLARAQTAAAITVHSVRAAKVLATAVQSYGHPETLQKMSLLCLSEAVLECLRTSGFGHTYTAPRPDEDALIETLQNVLRP